MKNSEQGNFRHSGFSQPPSTHFWKRVIVAITVSIWAAMSMWALLYLHVLSLSDTDTAHDPHVATDQEQLAILCLWVIFLVFSFVKTTSGRDVLAKFRGITAVIALVALVQSLHDSNSAWTVALTCGALSASGFYVAHRVPRAAHI
jgi:hypothetical protein